MSTKNDFLTCVVCGVQISICFEPRDVWVGVFWDRDELGVVDEDDNILRETIYENTIYICLLPMLPIRFLWYWTR